MVRKTTTEIANTHNNGQNEEDLVKEAIETVIIESLDVKANSVNGETVMEAKEAVIEGPQKPLTLTPKLEKQLKDYIPERYHKYLDVFTEKEPIDLPPHREWDHEVKLLPNAPASISCRAYPLSRAEEEFQTKYIDEQLAAGLI